MDSPRTTIFSLVEKSDRMNWLRIRPGERFTAKSNGRRYEIVEVGNGNAVVRDFETGNRYIYASEILRRLPIEERANDKTRRTERGRGT